MAPSTWCATPPAATTGTTPAAAARSEPDSQTPIFNDETDLEAKRDYFGGIKGKRAIVILSDGKDTCQPPSPCQVAQRIAKGGVDCWLVNTGWTGGKYGVGKRMPIRETRALLNAALDGSLGGAEFRTDENFGFEVPVEVPGIDLALQRKVGVSLDAAGRAHGRYTVGEIEARRTECHLCHQQRVIRMARRVDIRPLFAHLIRPVEDRLGADDGVGVGDVEGVADERHAEGLLLTANGSPLGARYEAYRAGFVIPPERLTRRSFLRRRFAYGATLEQDVEPDRRGQGAMVRGIVRIGGHRLARPASEIMVGDIVRIEEHRPISKLKRWTVIRGEHKKSA